MLAFFGISLPAVKIGGGLVVISAGWTILKGPDRYEREDVPRNTNPEDPLRKAFYPLTLPLTVGPGWRSVPSSGEVVIASHLFQAQPQPPEKSTLGVGNLLAFHFQ